MLIYSREAREYQSQRGPRDSGREGHHRPVSNYYEYESVQAMISHAQDNSSTSLPRRHQPPPPGPPPPAKSKSLAGAFKDIKIYSKYVMEFNHFILIQLIYARYLETSIHALKLVLNL